MGFRIVCWRLETVINHFWTTLGGKGHKFRGRSQKICGNLSAKFFWKKLVQKHFLWGPKAKKSVLHQKIFQPQKNNFQPPKGLSRFRPFRHPAPGIKKILRFFFQVRVTSGMVLNGLYTTKMIKRTQWQVPNGLFGPWMPQRGPQKGSKILKMAHFAPNQPNRGQKPYFGRNFGKTGSYLYSLNEICGVPDRLLTVRNRD